MTPIKVLIVDDSAAIRQLLSMAFRQEADFEVVGMVANGQAAIAALAQNEPDVMTLDLEMPIMDGLQTLHNLRQIAPRLPVVVLSSHSERGALMTLEALSRGAADYVAKPTAMANSEASIQYLRTELVPKVRAVCSKFTTVPTANSPTRPKPARQGGKGMVDIVCIGSSAGGPNALATLLPLLGGDFPLPVLVAQHMPSMFTRLLAERLAHVSGLPCREAVHGDALTRGCVYVAPGHAHLQVEATNDGSRLKVSSQQFVGVTCRPSVDVLFESVGQVFGSGTLAIVLSGMGNDGLLGCRTVARVGGQIFVQDRDSSVVWGMPGGVAGAGLADGELPLEKLASAIVRKAWVGRLRAKGPS